MTIAVPLEEAWEAVEGLLGELDVSVVLSPVVEELDELELALEEGIGRTEEAFDELLAAAQQALSGSGAGVAVAV